MRDIRDAALVPRQKVTRLLDQIGTLRLELHADDAISHCSHALCRLLGVADSAAAVGCI